MKHQYVVTVDVPIDNAILLQNIVDGLKAVPFITSVNPKHHSEIDNTTRRVIAVDFDLTICDSKYPECGPPKKGAKAGLQALREMGFTILIYSCRTCHWHFDLFGAAGEDQNTPVFERYAARKMGDWLDANEMPYDEIDDGTRGKPYADFYIDDKGIRFEDNWPEVIKFVEQKSKQLGLFN